MKLDIKVFGVGSTSDQEMVQKVDKVMEDLDLFFTFQHVSNIEEFMIQGLARIPTLKINDTIIAEGETPSVEELKKQIECYVEQKPTS